MPGQVFQSDRGCIIAGNPNISLATDMRINTTYDGKIQHRTPGLTDTGGLSGYDAYAACFPAPTRSLSEANADG